MGRAVRGGAALILLGGLTGCGTFSHYPAGMESTTLGRLRRGESTGYERTFGRRLEGRDGELFAMEMGRAAQLAGAPEKSRRAFDVAIERWEKRDDKAVVSVSGSGAQAGAVLVNDKAIPYRAASFERTLAHHYQMLNYLAMNDLTGAGVEVRRANLVQEAARKRREREIERAEASSAKETRGTEDDKHLAGVYAGLNERAGTVKHSFQNAATLYLSGVIWEMMGEPNDAYIDYKKAIEIYPDNMYLQFDVLRIGRRLGMREDVADFERRFPKAAKTGMPKPNAARLVVIYEEGLAPQKTDLTVAYPLTSADSIGVVSLPVYAESFSSPTPARVALDGRPLGQTMPLCNVGALAARALAEQMPGIVTRQVARAVAKGIAAKAAKDSDNSLVEVGVMLYTLFSEQADLRSWLTLPAHIHVSSAWVAPGEGRVTLSGPGGHEFWRGDVTLTAGQTTLVVVSRIDLAVYSMVCVQP